MGALGICSAAMTDTRPIALVTGGNTGIGFETCKGLIEAGYHVIVGARSEAKGNAAVEALTATTKGASAETLVLDLASLASVRTAAETFRATGRPLHVCVLNAGVMALPWKVTDDGFEQQWQVNVLGHFLLCRLLLPALEDAEDPTARIIHVASGAHRLHPEPVDYDQLTAEHASDDGYDPWRAYGRSKLANILLSNELARRLMDRGSDVTSNAAHPGKVKTDLWASIGREDEPGISPSEGALTSIHLATSDDVDGHTGRYFFQCKAVTRIYREEELGDADYVTKSATRTEISSSEEEAKRMWAAACKDVDLPEAL